MNNLMKLLSLLATLSVLAILAALEGGAINCGEAILLVIPAYSVLIWTLNRCGWLDGGDEGEEDEEEETWNIKH